MSAPGIAASRLATPLVLRLYVGAAWLAAALLLGVALLAIAADRDALQAVRSDTAPSIVAAEELGVHLAGLDSQLAVAMLGGERDREVAGELFELERSVVTRRLVDAANNITLGDAERIPIVVMSEETGRYLELASRAQSLHAGGDHGGALGALRLATGLMHDRILPQAAALDRANRDDMDRRYDRSQHASRLHELEALLAGGLLLTILVAAQWFVRARMRRRLVPALLAATLLSGAFTASLVGRFRDSREDLRVARDDAFNSIHLLWRARALAYDARGDEDRYLLGRAGSGAYASGFVVKVSQLSSTAGDPRLGAEPRGLLIDELHNVTFQGEAQAAQAALAALSEFVLVDGRIRTSEAQGQHAQAVDLAIGGGAGQAGAVFARLDAALERATMINQDAFDAVLRAADDGLRRAGWLDPALALAIALAAWLGVRPRLREYSA